MESPKALFLDHRYLFWSCVHRKHGINLYPSPMSSWFYLIHEIGLWMWCAFMNWLKRQIKLAKYNFYCFKISSWSKYWLHVCNGCRQMTPSSRDLLPIGRTFTLLQKQTIAKKKHRWRMQRRQKGQVIETKVKQDWTDEPSLWCCPLTNAVRFE